MPTLSLNTPVTEHYTGAAVEYTIAVNGVVAFEAWGGGGGGGVANNDNQTAPGGSGGNIAGYIPVQAGWKIKVETGQGGREGVLSTSGGAGGYPDGGDGGLATVVGAAMGGGGGSSRIYLDKNDGNGYVLTAVAGAGGGGLTGYRSGSGNVNHFYRYAGVGGGLTGGAGSGGTNTGFHGGGGTQSAGGAGYTTFQNGSFLQGGHGYPSGGNRTTANAGTGGGGGGGYYGGGGAGGASPNWYGVGGGGSSYLHATNVTAGQTYAGNGFISYNSGNKPHGGIGAGGHSAINVATPGGDGAVYLSLNSGYSATSLVKGDVRLEQYTGAAVDYTISESGILQIDAWGAGGGGGVTNNSEVRLGPGGGGGYSGGILPVTAGWVVRVEVGQGGEKGTQNVSGGLGGWPDGGNGGRGAAVAIGMGGGGGSTRVYIDKQDGNGFVLSLVAGAGGGSLQLRPAGSGGGTVGLTALKNETNGGAQGTGGTQSAGGTSTNAGGSGGYLQGGHGYPTGGNRTTAITAAGGGGGGGYYGGGGGGPESGTSLYGGGGGGSSYIRSGTFTQSNTWAGTYNGWPYNPGYSLPVGLATGGTSYITNAGASSGTGGAVKLSLQPAKTIALGEQTFEGHTGFPKEYEITSTGVLKFEAIGGGGGGGTVTTAGPDDVGFRGGGGGRVSGSVDVSPGWTVRVTVGQGGGKGLSGVGTLSLSGGIGGWPDGGYGARGADVNQIVEGGGGGSTRIELNKNDGNGYVLLAVAGAGGGGVGLRQGGSGGGSVGGTGDGGWVTSGTGGTQSAPGNNGASGQFGGNGTPSSIITVDTNGGSGGGGGYYGGGGGRSTTQVYPAGGGGSGYINPAYNGYTTSTSTIYAFEAPYTEKLPSPTGKGGFATRDAGVIHTNGYDGAVWLAIENDPTIDVGTEILADFVGFPVEYEVVSDGYLKFEAWGAGGGGGSFVTSTLTHSGGSGGYTTGGIPVESGDIIKVEVGGGGRPGVAVSGGAGGWPDGGNGGRGTASSIALGGGGGSTRIYKNGTLIAVAGGGGGTIINRYGGAGGALLGNAATPITGGSNLGTPGGGGTQSAGGTSPNSGGAGSSMQGGNGYATGGSMTTAVISAGGGGGGGYYGGGGGGGSGSNVYAAGGGGSGYLAPNVSGYMRQGIGPFPVEGVNGNRPSDVAVGGKNYTPSNATAGGNGAVWLEMTSLPDDLPETPTTIAYTGAIESYYATSDGYISYEMWGGGGGGHEGGTSATGTGGGGGNIVGVILVEPGDLVEFLVGQGGRKAVYSTTGGLGGYPDGGHGGRGNIPTNTGYAACGGGGGSTRIYVNGELRAIAAGGGGAGDAANGGQGSGISTSSVVANRGDGIARAGGAQYGRVATQSAGGAGGQSPSSQPGTFLTGGNGFYPNYDQTVYYANTGAGGGGGYYGGGGAGGSNAHNGSGGGGSSWGSSTDGAVIAINSALSGVAYDSGHKPSGTVGGGGTSGSTSGATDGYDGSIYYEFISTELATDGQSLKFPYFGSPVNLQVGHDGTVSAKLWGGGGGGGYQNVNALTGQGGGGGYTDVTFSVQAGDTVTLLVGQGGHGGADTMTNAYPDGGKGLNNSGFSGGGGGGATRILRNGTLVAVAGAGGGGAGTYNSSLTTHVANTPKVGGGGGGLTGGSGLAGAGVVGGGGTQSAGGSGDGPGSSLQGGDAGVTNTTRAGGGGGGGYFGGGGGATGSLTVCGGGGGGSSYINPDSFVLTGSMLQGNGGSGTVAASAANTGDPDYVAGVGTGGASSSNSAVVGSSGGNGYAAVLYTRAGDAVVAEGLVGTLTLPYSDIGTPPRYATVSPLIPVDPGTLTLASPATIYPDDFIAGLNFTVPNDPLTINTVSPDGGFTFFGDIGTITLASPRANDVEIEALFPGPLVVDGNIGGQGQAEALIQIPFVDYSLAFVSIEQDFTDVRGSASKSNAMPGPLSFVVPTGSISLIIDIAELIGGNELTLESPEGDAFNSPDTDLIPPLEMTFIDNENDYNGLGIFEGVEGPADKLAIVDSVITISRNPEAVLDIGTQAQVEVDLPPAISLITPEGVADDGTAEAYGDVGTILMVSPDGGQNGEYTYEDLIGTLTYSFVINREEGVTDGDYVPHINNGGFYYEGISAGGTGEPVPNGNSPIPGTNRYLARVIFGAPVLLDPTEDVTGQAFVDNTDDYTLQWFRPDGANVKSATILASIIPAQVELRPFNAYAGESEVALVDGDLSRVSITLDAPWGYMQSDEMGWAPVRVRRTMTRDNTPVTLYEREIALNELQGILYTRKADETIRLTPLASMEDSPPVAYDGLNGQLFRGDGTWGAITINYPQPARLTPPVTRVVLSEGVMGQTNATPANNTIYYRPFFVAKTMTISNIGIVIEDADVGSIRVGICSWTMPQTPDYVLIEGVINAALSGPQTITGTLTLTPGWYAAMIAVSGGSPILQCYTAPVRLNNNFDLVGDPTGIFTGNFLTLGTPSILAATSLGYLMADAQYE